MTDAWKRAVSADIYGLSGGLHAARRTCIRGRHGDRQAAFLTDRAIAGEVE
ncbi:hypothetical protein [Novosphingobium pokkalii]|uniref:Uncharacterized protein n=1 Tax=Novosphingobium pokkalii TaxID=1770194 RepID=A0ABV7V5S6_9SPHN|nr:hypothetical protein [Novosphingobium pokkalii]